MAEALDFLVIGGGPGGYTAALHAAHLGRSVTLVDRRGAAGLGGVCLHAGCVPTKALLRIAEAAAGTDTFLHAGLELAAERVDMAAFQRWKHAHLQRLARGVAQLLAAAGVRVLAGEARFAAPQRAVLRTPEGAEREVAFTDAVVAAGSHPVAPPGLPIDGVSVIDSTAALALDAAPPSMVVLGGGSVGMELGAAYAKLGTLVTIVEQADELLPMIDPVMVKPLRRRLAELDVEVVTSATVADLDGSEALVRGAGGERRVPAARVLAGVGRRPSTSGLDLAAAGVAVDAGGFAAAGADRRVTPHIAAIGDLTPGPFHAHKASAEAHVAVEALCGRPARFTLDAIPFIVHADPEVASVGVPPRQVPDHGGDLRTVAFPLRALGWALTIGARHGAAHLVIEASTGRIVGVHLVGPQATELIGEGALAVVAGATVDDLARGGHAHPTLSEQFAEAAHLAIGTPVHAVRRGLRKP